MHLTNRTSFTLSALACLSLGACAPSGGGAGGGPGGGAATRAEISAGDLRGRVGILADDSMRGRAVGSPGAAAASRYLAAEAARLGLRPAGDAGTFLQRVPLARRRTGVDAAVETSAGSRALSLDDLLPVSGIGGLPGTSRREGEGPLVFGGHLVDPSIENDDLQLGQLLGAAVIVRLSPAPGADASAPPRIPLASLFTPLSPASAVLLVAEEAEGDLWSYARNIVREGSLELAGGGERGPLPAFFLISVAEAERLLGAPLAESRRPRPDLGTFRYSVREEVSTVDAFNVVGILPGSGGGEGEEYVALGAHFDHEGVGPAMGGDSIYNGADDDASGVAALLEIAERSAATPRERRPRRSLLFVWHTAEEAGLLGSRSFTDRPPVPAESIVAQLNIDMIGRNGPDSLFLVGSRRLSSRLGELVEEANRAQPSPFALDYSLDAPDHPEQVYCRSDHYNYARLGIPVAFFTTGMHADYHEPSDEAETLDYQKLARVTRLVADVAGELAALRAGPVVDRRVTSGECPM